MTVQNLPGVTSGRTVTPRKVLQQAGRDQVIIVPVVLDGTKSYDGSHTSYEKYIRGGSLLGKITSEGTYVPLKRTKANGAGSSSTTLIVDNASFFRAGDSIKVGANAAQAIVSVTYSTNTITLTSSISWGSDDVVIVDDGSSTSRGILLDDEVALWDQEKTNNVDKTANMLIFGLVDESQVLGDLDAAMEHVQSAHNLRGIYFDDEVDSTSAYGGDAGELQHTYLLADGAANADLAEATIFTAGREIEITDVWITPDGSSAGVDGSNTSVWTVKRGDGGDTVVTETYDGTTTFPADGVVTSLGTVANTRFKRGQSLTLTVTNGTTANLPAVVVTVKYRHV